MPNKTCANPDSNSVRVEGKVTQSGQLKYTPSGMAIIQMQIAVQQTYLDKSSVGYFSALVTGNLAEEISGKFRVGSKVEITGSLWSRKYKNRQDQEINEFHIIAKAIGGIDEKG